MENKKKYFGYNSEEEAIIDNFNIFPENIKNLLISVGIKPKN